MRGMHPARFPTPAATLFFLLAACTGAPDWSGTVETQDGIEIISNPADPLLQETDELVSNLWEVQKEGWMEPSRIHVGSGLVTLVDPPANKVHLFSTSGEAQTSIGRPGEGPGEFLRLLDAFVDGERLVVLDGGKGGVQYLDREGAYLSSLHLEGQPWGGFALEGGTMLIKGEFLSDPRAESLGDWVSVNEQGQPVAFSSKSVDPLPEEQGVQCFDLSPWAQGAALMRFTTPQIQVLDQSGEPLMEAQVDLPIEVISEAERNAALDDLRERLAGRGLPPEFMQQNLVVMEERWKVKCRFGPLRFDSSFGVAAFLEQNPDEFGSGPATLHFLSEDGVYLARVGFATAWTDFAMDAGVVYALSRDPSTDLIRLKAYEIDFPTSLLSQASEVLDEARGVGAGNR